MLGAGVGQGVGKNALSVIADTMQLTCVKNVDSPRRLKLVINLGRMKTSEKEMNETSFFGSTLPVGCPS
jgi:hypothetical protein